MRLIGFRYCLMPQGLSHFTDSKPCLGERKVHRSNKSNSAVIKEVKEKHELNYKYNTNTNTCETGAMTNRV